MWSMLHGAIKDTLLIKEHWLEMDIDVYYMDIRAFGKSFKDLYRRARSQGIRFIMGFPAETLYLDWFTAAEGQKFADKIGEMKEIVEKVDPKEIDKAAETFKPKKKKRKQ